MLTCPQDVWIKCMNKVHQLVNFWASIQKTWASPKTWNTGLVSSGASPTSWGEGASLVLVGNPSSDGVTIKMPYPPRLWNTGLVSSGDILTSWGEGASLALVGHPSSDGVTIKMPYGVDVLHRPALHHIFSYWVG